MIKILLNIIMIFSLIFLLSCNGDSETIHREQNIRILNFSESDLDKVTLYSGSEDDEKDEVRRLSFFNIKQGEQTEFETMINLQRIMYFDIEVNDSLYVYYWLMPTNEIEAMHKSSAYCPEGRYTFLINEHESFGRRFAVSLYEYRH